MNWRESTNVEMTKEEIDTILLYLKLRKEGRIELVLCDCGRYYRVESEIDPWGTKYEISKEGFERFVRSRAERKGVKREDGTRGIRDRTETERKTG